MDHQSRLFQMLNAATSPPPNKSTTTASSPREPEPTPPPPSLQSVSLNDLFKGIQLQASSPAVSTNGIAAGAGLEKALNASVAGPTIGLGHVGQHTPGTRSASQASVGSLPVTSPPPPSGQAQDQRAKLLGMLSFGGSGAGTPVNVTTSGLPTPLSGHAQPESQASAPFGGIKSPVIHHSNPPQPNITSVRDPAIASPPIVESTATQTPEPAQPQKQAEQPRPKSAVPNFSFVSPFDAFDDPAPASVSPAKEKESEPGVVKYEEKIQAPASVPKEMESKKDKDKSTAPSKAPELPVAAQEASVKEESVADNDPPQNQQGSGPKTTQSHIIIDLSKPNLDSLISTPDLLYIQPTTLLKVDVGYKKGRKVGLTRQFVAYTMSKGKIRLIDSRSGARLMLQTTTSTPGPIMDIAVCPVYVAALAADRSLWIWRVPAGWREDNPPVDLVLISHTAGSAIGKAFKVGWVKRNGADWVIVAGDEGVTMFDPTREGRGVKKAEETFAGKTIFRTMGNVVDFCVNNTQSAMGILSTDSTFSLYSTQSLNRVWQRSIPSSSPNSPPSSAHFVESNVLIGRDQNTHFDLVQITVSLAVLSSIHFTAPPGLDASSHYAHAMYDPFSGLLFITPFARSSLYAFRYALKDTEPVRDAGSPNSPQVVAFDRMAEFPLAQQGPSGTGVVTIGMIAHLGRDPGPGREGGDLEWFYGTAEGFASAGMGKQALGLVKGDVAASAVASSGATATSVEPKKEKEAEKEAQPEKKEKKSAQSTPASKALPLPQSLPVPQPVPSIGSRTNSTVGSLAEDVGDAAAAAASTGMNSRKLKKEKRKEERALARAQAAAEAESKIEAAWGAETLSAVPEIKSERGTVAGEEALKQMEDRLSAQFQSLLTASISPLSAQLTTIASPSFSNNIVAQVEPSLRPQIMSFISSELQKNLKGLMPQLVGELGNEVQREVKSCLDKVPKNLEKGLGPVVSRTVAGVVQTSVEKMIQQAIHSHLLPTLTQSTSSLTDTLLTELKSEMLQMRKELTPLVAPVVPEAKRSVGEDELLNKLQEMSRQMEALQSAVKDIQGRNLNGINHAQSVSNLSTAQGPPPPPPPTQNTRLPTSAQLEDTFLAALTAQTVPSTLQLVDDHLGLTDYCLPVSGKSPLSQAVLLTLLHRTSIAIAEIPAHHPLFPHLVTWIRRTINLLDPSDPNIKEYIVRLHPVVQTHLSNVIASVQASGNPHVQAQFLPVLKEIGDVLTAKVNA
ncbi:hypothetical protein C359_01528 [Cryptococcus neoformans Bt120]|nr:hypothetical protein C359_01528 [Cryptococcus neoformans var. grubii Bt120]